jgi:hypothetical protein
MPSAAEQSTIEAAVTKLAERCAKQYGFDYTAPSAAQASDYNQLRRAYGAVEADTAAKYGYHLAPGDPGYEAPGTPLNPHEGGKITTAPLPTAEQLVLYGRQGAASGSGPGFYAGRKIPDGGCFGQASGEIAGAKQIDPDSIADAILVGMGKKAQSDSRVVARFRKWSACMAQSGYHYKMPLDAAGDSKWNITQRSQPGQAEIQTALADVKCKQSTNLIGIWFSVESAYENEAIQQELPTLTEVMDRWQAAAAKAAQVLGVPVPNPTPTS